MLVSKYNHVKSPRVMQRRPVGITGIFQAPTQKGPQSQKAICMQLCLRHSWNVYGAGGAGGAGGGGGGAGGTTSAPFFPPFERFIFGFAGLPANHPMEVACFGFGAFGFFPERTLELTTKRAPNNVEGATAGFTIPPDAERAGGSWGGRPGSSFFASGTTITSTAAAGSGSSTFAGSGIGHMCIVMVVSGSITVPQT